MPLRPLDRSACEAAVLLDLGTGTGASLADQAQRFGVGSALGIDRDEAKVGKAQRAGLPVFAADLSALDAAAFPHAKIVTFDNVLEHLPCLADVEAAVRLACAIASDLVYIRHPSFEHEEYLSALGLKQYWTDWPLNHTAPVRLHEFVAMASRIGVYNVMIRPIKRAVASDDPTILPLGAPPDQRKRSDVEYGVYDPVRHGPKPTVSFDHGVYFAFDIFLFLTPDAPSVYYQGDTDEIMARPFLRWPEPTGDRLPRARNRATPRRENRRAAGRRRVPSLIVGLTRAGVSLHGARELSVSDREVDTALRALVFVVAVDDADYILATRPNARWVERLRALRTCELRVGRRVRRVHVTPTDDVDKARLLQAYHRQVPPIWRRGPADDTANLVVFRCDGP